MVRAMSPFRFAAPAAFALALALWALSACATPSVDESASARPARPENTGPLQSVSFSAGPCMGACPEFSVTVSADGAVRYVGRRNAPLQGAHELGPNPALFAALSGVMVSPRLAPPIGDVTPGKDTCPTVATDLPSYTVRVAGGGPPRGFSYYSGCRGLQADRAQAIVDAIVSALENEGVPTGLIIGPLDSGAGGALASLTFEGTPCNGWCPDYSVTVSANGAVQFEGRRFAALQGTHNLPRNPALFAALSQFVAAEPRWPNQSITGDSPLCGMMISDLPEYRVRITRADASDQAFAIYLGCGGPESRRLADLASRVQDILSQHGVPTEGVRDDRIGP